MNNSEEMVKVSQKDGGVEISFSSDIPQDAVKAQVSSCQAETCTCCTPVFRENVESFTSMESADGMKVMIKGDITEDQVKENVLGCAPKLRA